MAEHLLGLPLKHKKKDIPDQVESLMSWVKVNRWYPPFQIVNKTLSTGVDLTPYVAYLHAIPFVFPRKVKVSKIGIKINSSTFMIEITPKCRIGFYTDNDIYPDALIEQAEVDLDVSATVDVILTFTTPQELRGVYWAVINIQDDISPDEWEDVTCSQYYWTTRYHFRLAGHTSITASLTDVGTFPYYRKAQAYGSLPDPFPSGATALKNPVLAFVAYITELL